VKPSERIALVAANGNLPSQSVLASLLAFSPYILAADGGANKLLERGIIAKAVLGDLDSAAKLLPDSIERILAFDQEHTDLDKCVGYLVEQGYETIWLIGATGDRLDHTFGSLSVLLKYGQQVQIALIDDIGTAFPIDGDISIETDIGQTISLIAVGPVTGIKTTGLRWNLDNETLAPGARDGISNEAAAKEVTISIGAGSLVIYALHQ